MPVWILHIAGLLTIPRQISFFFFVVYCNRGNIKNSIRVTENLRIFFTCIPNLLCGHSDYSFVDVLHVQESIESANTTIEDEDVKGWSIFCETCPRQWDSSTVRALTPFYVSSFNFLSVFWVSPPFAPHNQYVHLCLHNFHLYRPPHHTHTHLKPTHMPSCAASPALRLGSLVSSFMSSKNRSSQLSDSRQTPTSSVQCKSHPDGGRVAPLSAPSVILSITAEKETWSVVSCSWQMLLDFCSPCLFYPPLWSEGSVVTCLRVF